jgi:excisionase family DNA binding protein
MRDKLLNEDEVAEILGVSKASLYRLRKSGEIACYKIRGRVLFSQRQLDDYLARVEQNVKQATPAGSKQTCEADVQAA